jgi:hypothetical protein
MDVLLIIFLSAFLVEHVFFLFLGSYPYRYGFPIKEITLPIHSIGSWENARKQYRNLKLKVNEQRKEIYCRYKYQFGTGGPYLFTGQVMFSSPHIVLIRMGPCSGLLVLYLIITSILDTVNNGELVSLINVIAAFGIPLFFYFLLFKNLKQDT